MEPEIQLRPASGRCHHRLGLDPGAKPIRCHKVAIAKVADGDALCKEHLEERMHQLLKGERNGNV
jgi:hypothetical protein